MLVRQCQRGDEHAFAGLVRKYQQALFNLIYHSLGPRAEVEDIAQRIFAKVYFSLDKFDNTRPFFPWLYRIAVNQCHDEMRRIRRNRLHTFTDLALEDTERIDRLVSQPAASAPAADDPQEMYALLIRMLDRLNMHQRTALVLRDMEDVPYEKIAEIMRCSEQAARLKVHRARARLRQLVLKSLRRKQRSAGAASGAG